MVEANGKPQIPDGLWEKCSGCEQIIYVRELIENLRVCPRCGHYLRMNWSERIKLLTEPESFRPLRIPSGGQDDPLGFPEYKEKLKAARKKTGLKDAAVGGVARIGQYPVVLVVLDFEFMGGSMGAYVGKVVRVAAEKAWRKKLPLVIVAASGGARMQEGIISLMQMAKTNAALARLKSAGLVYISVLTDPTTGGVSASFALVADIIIAEKGALIGFAGPRVIEQTIRQKLPEGFQRADFLFNHGMIDIVVERKDLKNTLIKILGFFSKKNR